MRVKLQVNFDSGQDSVFFWCENGLYAGLPSVCLYIRGLEQDESKRKVQRYLSAERLRFSELFDGISLVLNVRRLSMVVDSLISAAKVCDGVISAWC